MLWLEYEYISLFCNAESYKAEKCFFCTEIGKNISGQILNDYLGMKDAGQNVLSHAR